MVVVPARRQSGWWTGSLAPGQWSAEEQGRPGQAASGRPGAGNGGTGGSAETWAEGRGQGWMDPEPSVGDSGVLLGRPVGAGSHGDGWGSEIMEAASQSGSPDRQPRPKGRAADDDDDDMEGRERGGGGGTPLCWPEPHRRVDSRAGTVGTEGVGVRQKLKPAKKVGGLVDSVRPEAASGCWRRPQLRLSSIC